MNLKKLKRKGINMSDNFKKNMFFVLGLLVGFLGLWIKQGVGFYLLISIASIFLIIFIYYSVKLDFLGFFRFFKK